MPLSPQLDRLLRTAVKEGLARVHTQVPGRVIDYNHDEQKAEVQLIVQHAFDDDGEVDYYKPAPLVNVPVIFPAVLTWPLENGDPGWVQIAERSIDEYEATGNDETRPRDLRRFDLSDAVFYPCYLRGEADTDDSAVVVDRRDGDVKIGGSSVSEFLARADRVESRLQAIEEYLGTHTHNQATPLIPIAPSPTTPAPASSGPPPQTLQGATESDHVQGD